MEISLTSLGIEYHRTSHTIYECENGNYGKASSQLITVEVLIRTLS